MKTITESTPRILVIDDESSVRDSIAAFLEDSGYRILTAANGREGLDLFAKEQPDLVLTDLQMPEVRGMEVLASIRSSSPDTPVIVISGAGTITDVVDALRAQAWDYILKPIADMEILA